MSSSARAGDAVTFLVLGGAGFLGRHVIAELVRRQEEVWGYDIRPFPAGCPCRAIVQKASAGPAGFPDWLREVDVLIHLAWSTQPGSSNDDPVLDVESNVLNSIRWLDCCVKAGVRKVVFLSSGGTVYGVPSALPVGEDHPTHPICSYGITKLSVEKYLQLYHRCHGLDHVILRASNAYGDWQLPERGQGIVSTLMWRMLHGRPVSIFGDGTAIRDYIHAEDLARAVVEAAIQPVAERVLNVGSGRGTRINELLEAIGRIAGRDIVTEYQPARTFDVPAIVLDIAKIRKTLGWEPTIGLSVGLRQTWEWLSRCQDIIPVSDARK